MSLIKYICLISNNLGTVKRHEANTTDYLSYGGGQLTDCFIVTEVVNCMKFGTKNPSCKKS